jgi:branched-chain amino acid transport system substrate-binding protein
VATETSTTLGGSDTTGSTTADTTTGETTETTVFAGTFDGEYVVGAVASMTGANAMSGLEQKWAQERAVKDINAAGGVTIDGKRMELKLKFVDDQSDSNQATACAEKLIKAEGVKVILGSTLTNMNLPIGQVCEKYKVLFITNFLWTSWAREKNWQYVIDACFTPEMASSVEFEAVKQKPQAEQPQNWCVLTEDTADGQSMGDALKANAEKYGYTVKLYETYTIGTKDFSTVILKMKQNSIDAVTMLAIPADSITFAKQLKEQDFSPKFLLGHSGIWPTEFATGLGSDSDYFCYDGFWAETLPYTGAAKLGQDYKDAHDGLDSVMIGSPYANVQVLARVMQETGSTDPATLRAAIAGHTFKDTVIGDLTFDAQGACDVPLLALQWIDGKRHVVYPKQDDLQWFVPWDER